MLLPQDTKDQIDRPVVLSEQVTTILQKAIFDGSIKEGEQLIEADLQLSLSASQIFAARILGGSFESIFTKVLKII
jgi:DNA-binding GntR family transcriptional regulator